jgi:hypothetical protein
VGVLSPDQAQGESEQAKGNHTVLVVVLALVLDVAVRERMDASKRPALWPGKSNAKSAIKRPRMLEKSRSRVLVAGFEKESTWLVCSHVDG